MTPLRRSPWKRRASSSRGAPRFIGLQPPEAKEVFRDVCRERGSALAFLDEETRELTAAVDARGHFVFPAAAGERPRASAFPCSETFQAENAALAYLTLRRTRPEITGEHCRAGFLRHDAPRAHGAAPGTDPGRAWTGPTRPLPSPGYGRLSARSSPARQSFSSAPCPGKNPREMAEIMAPAFSRIIISTPGTFKESNPKEVAAYSGPSNPATLLEADPRQALRLALEQSEGKRPILVTGSFYMVAEIRRLLR